MGTDKPKIVSITPACGTETALMSELKIEFDQPMMPDEFSVVDAYAGEGAGLLRSAGVISGHSGYDADSHIFTLPLVLPNNWNGQIKVSGFKSTQGVEAEAVVLDYRTLRDGFSKELLARFERARQSADLRELLDKVKEARAKLLSLSERVEDSFDFCGKRESHNLQFKMQEGRKFYADMSGLFNKPWYIGGDGRQCWFYYSGPDEKKLVAADFNEIDKKKVVICDLFGNSARSVEEVIRTHNLEYVGTEILDGRQCYIVRSWNVCVRKDYSTCKVDKWWIEGNRYMPVQMVSGSVEGRQMLRWTYERINERMDDSEFRPEAVSGEQPASLEPLGEGYDTRFVNVIDGSSEGRMCVGWGKRGAKGTSSSGVN
jgi:hypothetical protein